MTPKEDRKISFSEFEVDPEKRLLLRSGGEAVRLKSKTFDLLLTLIEHRGEILSKNNLLDLVWANQYVEENNLTVHIAALRKALGERKDENRFIVTVPGQGYKFVGKLNEAAANAGIGGEPEASDSRSEALAPAAQNSFEPVANDDGGRKFVTVKPVLPPRAIGGKPRSRAGSWRKPILTGAALALLAAALLAFFYFSKSRQTIDSVAVLPFVNDGADPKMDYLSDGITERLINDLSLLPNLKVIARNSVFHYKKSENAPNDIRRIAGELGVQAILTGRVVQRGDDLVISVELIDASDNTHLWGERYNRKFSDVFDVQKEISGDITRKLRVRLSSVREPAIARRDTDNIKAFESYMTGRLYIHRRTREDLLIAVGYYEEAIKEDPNYAQAYAGLAEAYGNLGVRGYISPTEGRRKLEAAARRAVELDETLAEGHTMLGYSLMGFAPFNFPAAEKELRRAIEISPSLAIAHLYLSLSLLRHDRLEEGFAEMQRARELDPFSAIIARQVALYYYLKRDIARALEVLARANEIGPAFTTIGENGIYVRSELHKEALAALEHEKQQRKDDPLLIAGTGMICAAEGRRAEAQASIEELKRLSGSDLKHAQWIAKIYALRGESDEALNWLKRGFETGSIGAFYKDEPLWDGLRGDPRFKELVREMGIP
jgi:TolB-like protein/DNA-binding winged helix-turn-helix (wHTH) protein/Flp pilus assembly protein TadD